MILDNSNYQGKFEV